MMIPCGNMDRSTHPALHFTGTIINQIHNLFYHLFTCPAYFFLFNYYIVGGLVARICSRFDNTRLAALNRQACRFVCSGKGWPRKKSTGGTKKMPVHIFDWSLGFAVPWTFSPFAPSPSMGSRFFCLCSPSGSGAGAFARKHSTGSRPPAQVRSFSSPQSSQVGTWVGRSVGKWFFQRVASIFPVSRKRCICRAVYFIRVLLAMGGFMKFGWGISFRHTIHRAGLLLSMPFHMIKWFSL
jgi:hypothetical protein